MEKKKVTIHKKSTPVKQRNSGVYQQKVDKITKWYNNLVENRKKETINPNTKLPIKLKELKPLDFYLSKVKKGNQK